MKKRQMCPSRWLNASYRAAALLLLSVGVAHAGQPDPDTARQWLAEMSSAVSSANYDGIVVYRSGDTMETMRIVHGEVNGVERERMVSLTGQSREILRNDDAVICILPEQKAKLVDGGGVQQLLPSLSSDTLERLSSYYTFDTVGQSRIAGRTCQGVTIKPKDDYRYGYTIWIDTEKKVPLKVTLSDETGEALEEIIFTQVLFPDVIAEEAFESQYNTRGFKIVSHDESPVPGAPESAGQWVAHDLPRGFKLQQSREAAGAITHLLLSDGLSSVSVFAASSEALPKTVFEGVSSMGAVHAFGRMRGEHHVTVVGEVPARTVELIGNGLRLEMPTEAAGQ